MKRYFITIGFLFLFLMRMSGTAHEIAQTDSTSTREVLFFSDFSSAADFNDKWTVVNANEDALAWAHNEYTWGADNAAGIAHCYTNGSLQTDDYLVSSSVALSNGDHYITFYFKPWSWASQESLRLLYGTTPDPTQMTEVLFDQVDFDFRNWRFISCNFNVEEAGSYYFAFHAYSPANSAGVWVDHVTVGTGSFTGAADLALSGIVLPASACGLTDNTEISCTVTNKGTLDVEDFALRLLSNGAEITTIDIEEGLFAGESRTVSLGKVADFSKMGTYEVSVVSVFEGDSNSENNTVSGSVTHLTPVSTDELPRNHIFKTEGRIYADEWLPEAKNDWMLQSIGWRPNYINKPLYSRCFNFIPGKYRIEMTYKAGNSFYMYTDDFKILMGRTGTDITDWEVIREFTDEITEEKTGTASFVITEEGVYTFAIVSTRFNTLWIYNFLVRMGFDNDISVENGTMHSSPYTIYSMIPVEHMKTEYDFSATIINNGSENATNAKISIIGANDVVLAGSEAKTLAPRETYGIEMKSPLTGFAAEEMAEVKIKALMEQTDEFPDDNIQTIQFFVSDSILAVDAGRLDMPGVEIHQPFGYGTLIQFLTADTLTSINIGWGENTSDASNFFLSLYKVEYPSGYLLKKFFTIPATRPESNIEVNYQVPNLLLPPDYYYIEIKQIDTKPLNIAADYGSGRIFATTTNPPGYITPDFGVGFPMIRPCFGHNGSVLSKDAVVISIDEPAATKGLYAVNESIVATIENNGAEVITRLEIRCTVNDGEPVVRYVDNLQPYTTYEVVFEADLSALGENTVVVSTHLEGDEAPDNNAISQVYYHMEPTDPYKMNFEECQDFAYRNLNPAWTTYDGDDSPTVEFVATFPNMQKNMGFMAFTPSKTTPSSTSTHTYPYEGEKFGASIRTESGQRNDWLISPKLLLGDKSKLSLYAKTNSPSLDLEKFNVLVSTTDNRPASFQRLGDTYTVPTEWTAYVVDLSAYDNQSVHIAIQCVTTDGLIFMIDAIEITFNTVSVSSVDLDNALTVYPNPAHDVLQVNCNVPVEEIFVNDIMGRTVFQYTPKAHNGQYRINVGSFSPGIYLLNVRSAGQVATRKFVVN